MTPDFAFTFGRFNPPTRGHEKLFDLMASKGLPWRVYSSRSYDRDRNPLHPDVKLEYLRKIFPEYSSNFSVNPEVRTVLEAATEVYSEGSRRPLVVVGSDRLEEMKKLLVKYNGIESSHGFYEFDDLDVESAGNRDDDAYSATQLREAARSGDFVTFALGLPARANPEDAICVYASVAIQN